MNPILFFLPSIICVAIAGVLATLGHDGWRWFLVAAVAIYSAGAAT